MSKIVDQMDDLTSLRGEVALLRKYIDGMRFDGIPLDNRISPRVPEMWCDVYTYIRSLFSDLRLIPLFWSHWHINGFYGQPDIRKTREFIDYFFWTDVTKLNWLRYLMIQHPEFRSIPVEVIEALPLI